MIAPLRRHCLLACLPLALCGCSFRWSRMIATGGHLFVLSAEEYVWSSRWQWYEYVPERERWKARDVNTAGTPPLTADPGVWVDDAKLWFRAPYGRRRARLVLDGCVGGTVDPQGERVYAVTAQYEPVILDARDGSVLQRLPHLRSAREPPAWWRQPRINWRGTAPPGTVVCAAGETTAVFALAGRVYRRGQCYHYWERAFVYDKATGKLRASSLLCPLAPASAERLPRRLSLAVLGDTCYTAAMPNDVFAVSFKGGGSVRKLGPFPSEVADRPVAALGAGDGHLFAFLPPRLYRYDPSTDGWIRVRLPVLPKARYAVRWAAHAPFALAQVVYLHCAICCLGGSL